MAKPNTPPEVVEFFRACVARRRREDRPCAVCGQLMPNALAKRRYCSEACHSRARHERARARSRDG
jgi:predicted nucleic acid-binding Zn ribbon protein